MKNFSPTLFIEVNDLDFIFFVGKNDEQNNFKIIYTLNIPVKGFEHSKVSDFELVFNTIKENVYLIEQNLNYTFKEIVLILENLNPTFINLTGFKKLNGSQILRTNITYILNILKSYVDKIEIKKTILHIFNSKFYLDDKQIENLPIGLFGDFYSHELSFILINTNDYKNLKNIFEKCNLKIKKILLKSFIKGAHVSDKNPNIDTFFQIEINRNNSKIFYFENNSLKFEQNFKFGSDIILKDISKITSLKKDTIKKILNDIKFSEKIAEDDLIEEKYFEDNNFIKIKKKLIKEIVSARIDEILELMLFRNINLQYYNKNTKVIFFEFNDKSQPESLKEIYKIIFSKNNKIDINFLDNLSNENMINTTYKLVHYGWKKEAIPTTQFKKSLIARFFYAIFG